MNDTTLNLYLFRTVFQLPRSSSQIISVDRGRVPPVNVLVLSDICEYPWCCHDLSVSSTLHLTSAWSVS